MWCIHLIWNDLYVSFLYGLHLVFPFVSFCFIFQFAYYGLSILTEKDHSLAISLRIKTERELDPRVRSAFGGTKITYNDFFSGFLYETATSQTYKAVALWEFLKGVTSITIKYSYEMTLNVPQCKEVTRIHWFCSLYKKPSSYQNMWWAMLGIHTRCLFLAGHRSGGQ